MKYSPSTELPPIRNAPEVASMLRDAARSLTSAPFTYSRTDDPS